MLIKFNKTIRLLAKLEEFDQEWEFDEGEMFEVWDVIYGEPQKVKTRPGKPGGRMRFANLILKENCEDHIWFVAEDLFTIIKE
jgi:hypothetical protein